MSVQQAWLLGTEWLLKWLGKRRPEVVILFLILAVIVAGTPWAITEVKSHIHMLTVANAEVTKLNNESHERQMQQQLAAFERVHDKDAEANERSHQLIRDLLRDKGVDISELKPSGVAVINPKEKKQKP